MHDYALLNQLRELVLCCDLDGTIGYANTAALELVETPLIGQSFTTLLSPSSQAKGQLFLSLAASASELNPTDPWELPIGNELDYRIVRFRGYAEYQQLVIVGETESPEIGAMQRELLALTAELGEAQREERRQNRQLQQALVEQRTLLDTIQQLSAPSLPVWDRVLLLPLVGHFDSARANQVNSLLLERAAAARAQFVILDLSGIALVDTAVAQQLIQTAQALRLLGVQPVLVGVNPEIAQTVVNLGVELPGFIIRRDLHSALAYVLTRIGVIHS
ncbi:MAG: STAS domain-containing protein [Oscillochloridaceae bacterium umkhey_bin13]